MSKIKTILPAPGILAAIVNEYGEKKVAELYSSSTDVIRQKLKRNGYEVVKSWCLKK